MENLIGFLLSAIALALGGMLVMMSALVKKHDSRYGKIGDMIGWFVVGVAVLIGILIFVQIS
ncbi:hypothetical protein CBW65_09205 [Tumebacillus avium]|uniref:Uncharacterized protein n=1 Tax=Tumebacillus avium TaxID=1903704 RepID=A0A1Y0IL28_9BACL|nr:hypothetical protein [Tumebacillus avium]ARU61192.1 hypothetical protein CBW65_09205 [Tumebacillus avium]